MTSVLKLIHKPLSDADLRRILGNDIKIVVYSQLANFRDLDELLPKPLDCCIILYEEMPRSGHWVGLSKYNGLYEHFDSYGVKVDRELEWLNMRTRQSLRQVEPNLTNLLKRELDLDGERYIWNKVRYQSKDESVNTCGSHVSHRLYRLLNDHMTLDQYHEFMRETKERTGASYDNIVAEWVRSELL